MRPFIIKTFLWVSGASMFSLVFALYFCDSHFDPYYKRLSSAKQESLVLGTSRAAQGIVPDVINRTLRAQGRASNLYNFAFSQGNSPFGPWYLQSIKDKLKSVAVGDKKNKLFILCVDPWNVSGWKENDIPQVYKEKTLPPYALMSASINPNIEYLFKYYQFPRFNLVLRKWLYQVNTATLHDDGWLEVRLDRDSAATLENTRRHIREKLEDERIDLRRLSPVRLESLQQLIGLLKERGSVFLVRMPVPPLMLDLENQYCADFNEQMKTIARRKDIVYMDYSGIGTSFRFNDGNHLHFQSGLKFSQLLADSIVRRMP